MVANWKKQSVGKFEKSIKSHRVFGVVSVKGIPSKQLQTMRRKLKGQVDIIVSRSTLIKRALTKAGIKGMDEYLVGPSGIILSDLNPFQLEKIIYSCKTKAPAKPGSIAPYDLIIPAGDTGLAAGPVIGDFQAAGVKAKIQGGKIVVSEDSLLVKSGEVVGDKAAAVLARLGVEPMDIVLTVNAAYEDGIIYSGDVLHIDEGRTTAKLQGAYAKAFNLSYNARIYNKAVLGFLIQEVVCKTRNLMINAEIVNKETVGIYLAKADATAKSLQSVLPPELLEATDEKKEQAPPEEKKEQPKQEEKKDEAPPEQNKD